MRILFTVLAGLLVACSSQGAPANDAFASRTILSATNRISGQGQNEGASRETGEPTLATNAAGMTVWWEWTPPTNGAYLITTDGSSFDTLLGIYAGNSVSGLTLIGKDDNGVNTNTTQLVGDLIAINATTNTAYKILVDGKSSNPSGNIVLTILPNNDLETNRIVLTGSNVLTTAYNGKATKETNENNHATGGAVLKNTITIGKSLWWEWHAPVPGSYLISTYPSTFPTMLAVYTNNASGVRGKAAVDTATDWGDQIGGLGNLASIYAASTNTAFYIAVDGWPLVVNGYTNAQSGQITLSIMPNNDSVQNAIQLTGAYASTIGYNGLATTNGQDEVNMSSYGGYDAWRTVWWKWSPPTNGAYLVTTFGSMFPTFLAAFTNRNGTLDYANLTWATDANAPASLYDQNTSLISIPNARTNQTYYIMVDGMNYGDWDYYGQIELSIQPDNNYFTNRIMLSGMRATSISYNGLANTEGSEVHPPDAYYSDNTVWWGWVAPTNGIVHIDTFGSDFLTVLGVWVGTGIRPDLGYYSLVAGSSRDPETFRSVVEFPVVQGQEYEIQVTGIRTETAPIVEDYGQAVLNLVLDPSLLVANDNRTNATVLTGTLTSDTLTNKYATKETGEPNHAGVTGGRSVWWQWTPTSTGPVTINTEGSLSIASAPDALNTALAVYTNSGTRLYVVASNVNSSLEWTGSSVTFTALASRTYWIAVDCGLTVVDQSLDYGTLTLNLEQLIPPPNDNFTNRITVTGLPTAVTGSNVNASKETGEYTSQILPGYSSIWYSWKSPITGKVTFTTDGSEIYTILSVYGGTTFAVTNLLAQNDGAKPGFDYSRIDLDVVSNRTYNIAIESQSEQQGAMQLNIFPSLQTLAISPAANGAVKFRIPTVRGFEYQLYYSQDLTNWTYLFSTNAPGGMLEFQDPRSGDDLRFYMLLEQ